MRAFEFLSEKNNELSDQELRTQIIVAVNQADRQLLDKFYHVLDAGDIDEKLSAMLSGEEIDKDAARIKDDLVNFFLTIKGSTKEKKEFVDQFSKGFIDVTELLKPESSIDRWFTGNSFAKKMFEQVAIRIRPQGIGPGEYALAAFSPLLKSTGLIGGGGDLLYGEGDSAIKIELKGKVSKWGRMHDPKKMDYDIRSIKTAFQEAGVDSPTLTVVQWLQMRKNFDGKTVNSLSKTTVDNLFKHVDDASKAPLIQSLSTGGLEQIKSDWGKLSVVNYAAATKFSGILFYDVPSGKTNYVSDPSGVNFTSDAPQMYGPERDAMPKTQIKI